MKNIAKLSQNAWQFSKAQEHMASPKNEGWKYRKPLLIGWQITHDKEKDMEHEPAFK